LKALFDTNVLVSAFATEGLCARLLIRANRREFDLLISSAIRKEFEKALQIKIGLSPGEIRESLGLLDEAVKTAGPARHNTRLSGICRDESDHAVLEAALARRAEFIVTGDRDLLDVGEFHGIKILTPREFELLFN
jgi:putative PIN family toxin of toxin-antitoxin system